MSYFNDTWQAHETLNNTTINTAWETTNINEGNTAGANTTVNDFISLMEDGNGKYQTYIFHKNDNGEIRFHNQNAQSVNDLTSNVFSGTYSDPRLTHNTKINKDGVVQFYHTYSLFNPGKISGWYSVYEGISGSETGAIATGVALATLGKIKQLLRLF